MAVQFFYNKTNNDLVNKLDSTLSGLIKDADKNIRYIKVVSQEEFNKTETSNNTLYFINDIYDTVLEVSHILDVAISHTSEVFEEPEQLWVLTADEEMTEVDLWVGNVDYGEFKLIKTYEGYIDGRLTFDGVYEYLKGDEKSTLITKNEPFIILINEEGELYAFPNLRYKSDQGLFIDGSSDSKITTCSVDKGYCSELFKGDDQGIVIAYVKEVENSYKLYTIQYGYASNDSSVKNFGVITEICSTPGAITSIAVRRLSDYRVGLTYNYWDGNIAKAEFRYSIRTYSGIAFHPEYIELNEIPSVGTLLYGAVRNDNISRIEVPTLAVQEKPETNQGNVKLIFELYSRDPSIQSDEELKKINLQVLSNNDPNQQVISDKEDIKVNLSVVNTYPYENYATTRDPYFGHNTNAIAIINSIKTQENKIIVELTGDNIPMTPFEIIPSLEANNNINIRYVGSDFNNEDNSIQIEGWFALDKLVGSNIGSEHKIPFGAERHKYIPLKRIFTVQSFSPIMLKSSTKMEDITFRTNININYVTNKDAILLAPNTINEAANGSEVRINELQPITFTMQCDGGANINV